MALVDAATALRASGLIALKWKNVGWGAGILQSEFALVEGEWKETKSRNNRLPLAESVLQVLRLCRENTAYRSDEVWIFCQSALSRQDAIHHTLIKFSSVVTSGGSNLWNQEQQGNTCRMADAAPVASDTADLKLRECESRTVTASSHNPKDCAGSVRTARFSPISRMPTRRSCRWCFHRNSRRNEGAGRYRNGEETRSRLSWLSQGARNQPC
jgi:hypothetical protein